MLTKTSLIDSDLDKRSKVYTLIASSTSPLTHVRKQEEWLGVNLRTPLHIIVLDDIFELYKYGLC